MKAKDLKNSILQMAVQGKLVPQDPSDEPASVLLERIREERAKLIKEKKIKAPKGGESVIYLGSDGSRYEKRADAKGHESEPVCIDDEIPFGIPEGWEWARLESVTIYIQRGKSPKYSTEEKYPVVAQKCNQWSGFSLEKAKFVDPDSVASYAEERVLVDGDLLWNSTGLGTLGRMAIYDSGKNPYGWAVADSHVTVIRTAPSWLNYEYAFHYFAGPSVQSVIEDQASGSTKQKELAQETVKRYLIPIPPLAEQRRIAKRVSELIPLVEEYGELEDEREVLDAALSERLRKSVLQMAVEGKLVPQDPADEPASALLERIRTERAKLIAEKKIKAPKGGESVIYLGSDGRRYEKRGKGEPACIDDEIPFEIPEDWEWARLGWLFDMQAGKNISASYIGDKVDEERRIPCFGGNGIRGYVARSNREGNHQIIGRQGALCGCVNYARGPFYATEHAIVVTAFGGIENTWTGLILRGLNLNQYATATAQPGLAVSKIAEVLVPVPPLSEQKRITKQFNSILASI